MRIRVTIRNEQARIAFFASPRMRQWSDPELDPPPTSLTFEAEGDWAEALAEAANEWNDDVRWHDAEEVP